MWGVIAVVAEHSRPLVGNRLVLTGAVLYLLEWVAIIAGPVMVPVGAEASAREFVSGYQGNTTALAWAAGWFSVVLLGRVLMMTGLRQVLNESGRPQALMDLAVPAMLASVVVEVVVYAVTAGTAWSLENQGSMETARMLDAAAWQINQMIFGPLGMAVVCAAAAMWLSGLFPKVLCVVGLVGGAAGLLTGLAFSAPELGTASAVTSAGVPLFWIWMLWTGVLCWRAAGARERQHVDAS